MTAVIEQRKLSTEQIAPFYHDEFVEDQARDFVSLVGSLARPGGTVADVGGGCGFFAKRLAEITARRVKVLDTDPASIEACRLVGIEAVQSDALSPKITGDEDVVTFNLILHHLIGQSERATTDLQQGALTAWRNQALALFVNEYIYESYFGGVSGRLIYFVTRSKVLSFLAAIVSKVLPSLKANTLGVGVRFREHAEWIRIFDAAGFEVRSTKAGREEPVSLPRRLLLIKRCRRDSFLLLPRTGDRAAAA